MLWVQNDYAVYGVGWSRLVLVLGFEVIDEDVEEVVGSLDAVLNPETRDLVDGFLTVEQSGDFAEVGDDLLHFLAVLCGGHVVGME